MTKRNFKGIWIPKFIWENKDLTIMEKVFIVEIDSLDNEHGCFASNNYFAGFFNVTPQRCSQIINSLIKKGFLKAKYEYEGKEIVKRVLNILTTYQEKFKEGIKKSLRGYQENVKDNNTVSNTLINNIHSYWNSKNIIVHNKLTDDTKNKIKSRLKDYTFDDIKKSIDNYYIIITGKKYYFDYKWTLKDFMGNIEKFLHDVCFTNYLANSEKGKFNKPKDSRTATESPDYIKYAKKKKDETPEKVKELIQESLGGKKI